jgi:hypothetical protein
MASNKKLRSYYITSDTLFRLEKIAEVLAWRDNCKVSKTYALERAVEHFYFHMQ